MRQWDSLAGRGASRFVALAVAGLLGGAAVGGQSLSYSSGQPVAPAYEGWEEYPDGSRAFVFGYMNRNWEEEIDVPVGSANSFSPGSPDQGQPTRFLPRRNRFTFRVPVPEGFTDKDELVWTLTTHGKTEKAYATLRADYKMDDMILASESGALGAGSSNPEIRANRAPKIEIQGPKHVRATVGRPLRLVAVVVDDSIPKVPKSGRAGAAVESERSSRREAGEEGPANAVEQLLKRAMVPPSRVTVGKHVGLHLSWFVYRGAGRVTFSPEQISPWEDTRVGANSPWAPIWEAPPMPSDGRILVDVTFADPGDYVLRARADDGALTSDGEVAVTVTR